MVDIEHDFLIHIGFVKYGGTYDGGVNTRYAGVCVILADNKEYVVISGHSSSFDTRAFVELIIFLSEFYDSDITINTYKNFKRSRTIKELLQ